MQETFLRFTQSAGIFPTIIILNEVAYFTLFTVVALPSCMMVVLVLSQLPIILFYKEYNIAIYVCNCNW